VVTLLGIVRLLIAHPSNVNAPMLLTLVPITSSVKLLQFRNAMSPMSMTLFGIRTLVRFEQWLNAPNPMPVTGRSLITLGILTAPPAPVYFVMVIVLLLVV
jgi:hypothetical protein